MALLGRLLGHGRIRLIHRNFRSSLTPLFGGANSARSWLVKTASDGCCQVESLIFKIFKIFFFIRDITTSLNYLQRNCCHISCALRRFPLGQLNPHVEVIARLLDGDSVLADRGQNLLSQCFSTVGDTEPQVARVERCRGPEGELVVAVVEVCGLKLGGLAAAGNGGLGPGQRLVEWVHADLSHGEVIAGDKVEAEFVPTAGHGSVLLCGSDGWERGREGEEGGHGEKTHGGQFVVFLFG